MLKESSERRFYRYAHVCSYSRFKQGLISCQDYDRLRLLEQSGEPERTLLEHCFPEAMAGYLSSLMITKKAPWTIRSVSDYWRNYHIHGKVRDVFRFKVIEVPDAPNTRIIKVRVGERQFPLINYYNLPIWRGLTGNSHKEWIIELFRS